jgi:hypothetical protein
MFMVRWAPRKGRRIRGLWAVLRQRVQAQAQHELGDEDPAPATLRSLGGAHETRIQTSAEEIMAELRQTFADT